MAKKQDAKIPKGMDMAKLIQMGKAAEKEFKKDAIKQVQSSDNEAKTSETKDINPPGFEENVPQSFTAALKVENPKVDPIPEKKSEEVISKEEILLATGSEIAFEEFLKKYIPADTDKRESAYVYTTNLFILKAIATSEGAVINDMINNIIAAWIQKYQKNIRKSLQKPSKIFG